MTILRTLQSGNMYKISLHCITAKRKLFHFTVLNVIFDSPIDLQPTDNFPTALCYVMTFCVPRTCLIRPGVSIFIRIDKNNT